MRWLLLCLLSFCTARRRSTGPNGQLNLDQIENAFDVTLLPRRNSSAVPTALLTSMLMARGRLFKK